MYALSIHHRSFISGLVLVLINAVLLNVGKSELTIASHTRSVFAEATACNFAPSDVSTITSTLNGDFSQSVSEEMSAIELTERGEFLFCTEDVDMASAAATQNSTIRNDEIQGAGVATASAFGLDGGSAEANSHFSVIFQVDTPTAYQLFGVVAGSRHFGPGPRERGDAQVALLSGEELIHSAIPNEPDEFGFGTTNAFSFAGTLMPGTYTLNAEAKGMYSGSEGGADATFSFTFVPEPNAPFLLIGALALIYLIRTEKANAR